MQERKQRMETSYFFGPYIRNTHTVYGYDEKKEKETKKKEKEMFEMIKDYIEQA